MDEGVIRWGKSWLKITKSSGIGRQRLRIRVNTVRGEEVLQNLTFDCYFFDSTVVFKFGISLQVWDIN